MTETLAHEYSSESTQQKLSNEYQHDKCLECVRYMLPVALEYPLGDWNGFCMYSAC